MSEQKVTVRIVADDQAGVAHVLAEAEVTRQQLEDLRSAVINAPTITTSLVGTPGAPEVTADAPWVGTTPKPPVYSVNACPHCGETLP